MKIGSQITLNLYSTIKNKNHVNKCIVFLEIIQFLIVSLVELIAINYFSVWYIPFHVAIERGI